MKNTKLKTSRLNNNKGVALILSYLVLAVMITLTAGFAISTVGELNYAQNYRNSTAAFWLAESGINRFIQNTALLDSGSVTYNYGSNSVTLSKDDTDASKRVVTAAANVNGVTRSLAIEYPATAPGLFDNTMTSGSDITLTAFFAGIDVNQQTRLAGAYSQSGIAIGLFEDKIEGVPSSQTTLTYPDTDGNSTPDEFTDFVQFNQNTLSTYPSSDVVYVTRQATDGPLEVWPNGTVEGQSLVDKKVLYVEGPSSGTGDVDIYFGTSWAADQNLTVISTGTVTYLQPLENLSNNSKLNTISWDNYEEGAIFYSAHNGVTYSHEQANFGSLISVSNTIGNLIANDSINFVLGGVWKNFDYGSPYDSNGLVPPGFEGLLSAGGGGYQSTPSKWSEI